MQTSQAPQTKPEQQDRRQLIAWLRDSLEIIIIAIILYFVVSNIIFTVRVDGTSMEPGLQTGNLLIVNKAALTLGTPQRGDIVILNPPIQSSNDFIKRIIGLPGDVIEIDGTVSPTRILIKPGGKGPWEQLVEPYLPSVPWTVRNMCCTPGGEASAIPAPVTVPPHEYFVLGDNRNVSEDSRIFGFVQQKDIFAVAFFRLFPFNEWGTLGESPTLVPLPQALSLTAMPGRMESRQRISLSA